MAENILAIAFGGVIVVCGIVFLVQQIKKKIENN